MQGGERPQVTIRGILSPMSDNGAHVGFGVPRRAWRCDPSRGSDNVARTMTRTAAALALFAVGVAARPAQAELEATAVANVAAGATNNPLSVGGRAAEDERRVHVRSRRRHGRYLGLRSQQSLSYTYSGTFYAQTTAANTNAHDLLWTLLASPTARTDVQAQVDGTYGRLNSINPVATLERDEPAEHRYVRVRRASGGPGDLRRRHRRPERHVSPHGGQDLVRADDLHVVHPDHRPRRAVVRRDPVRALRAVLGARRADGGRAGQLLRFFGDVRRDRRRARRRLPDGGRAGARRVAARVFAGGVRGRQRRPVGGRHAGRAATASASSRSRPGSRTIRRRWRWRS